MLTDIACREVFPLPELEVELFRADAKAEDDTVALGGWLCFGGVQPKDAKWYSLRLTKKGSPWVFAYGEPYRVIASLELLATLICIMILVPHCQTRGGQLVLGTARPIASTDNKGNKYVAQKLLTTNFHCVRFSWR